MESVAPNRIGSSSSTNRTTGASNFSAVTIPDSQTPNSEFWSNLLVSWRRATAQIPGPWETMAANESENGAPPTDETKDNVTETMEGTDGEKDDETNNAEETQPTTETPTAVAPNPSTMPPAAPRMTVALFVFWVVPVVLMAVASRFTIDTTPPPINMKTPRPVSLDLSKASKAAASVGARKKKQEQQQPKQRRSHDDQRTPASTRVPTNNRKTPTKPDKPKHSVPTTTPTKDGYPSTYPTSYQGVSFVYHFVRCCGCQTRRLT